MLSPQTFPRLEYLSREDISLTDVREGGIRKDANITDDMLYPQPASFPTCAENAQGEIELLGEIEATLWYAEADGITWHFVTTGNPNNDPSFLYMVFPKVGIPFITRCAICLINFTVLL